MNELLKGNPQNMTPDHLERLELMQRLREAWEEERIRRIEVIQDIHCSQV